MNSATVFPSASGSYTWAPDWHDPEAWSQCVANLQSGIAFYKCFKSIWLRFGGDASVLNTTNSVARHNADIQIRDRH
jgi:hypothetical protein